ncbi:MAG: type II secretion system protein, partial [Victivallales bacterium]
EMKHGREDAEMRKNDFASNAAVSKIANRQSSMPFTLVELLVVISIISILAALLLSAHPHECCFAQEEFELMMIAVYN